MKNRINLLFLSASLLLCGCKSIKNNDAIKVSKNYEHEAVTINVETIKYMVEQKYSFHLLMYTVACSYCEKAKDNIAKLLKEIDYTIYQIEIYDAAKQYLIANLPNVFKASDTYPNLYIFNNGDISYKSDYLDLITYSKLKKMIKAYSIDTNIATLTKLESYQTYKSKHSEYLLYTYDSKNSDEQMIYSKYLFKNASESKKNTLIVDKNIANPELLTEIYKDYQTNNCLLSVVENGQIKTTLEYANQSGSDILKLVNVFFDIDAVSRSC